MKRRVANALEISVALGAAVMGLGTLAAASFGEAGLRLAGFAFLAVGGATAATLRWRREQERLDQQAVAELEAARTRLAKEDYAGAAAAASRAAKSARTPRTRNGALSTLAWAALAQGYPERAKAALDGCHRIPSTSTASRRSRRPEVDSKRRSTLWRSREPREL